MQLIRKDLFLILPGGLTAIPRHRAVTIAVIPHPPPKDKQRRKKETKKWEEKWMQKKISPF